MARVLVIGDVHEPVAHPMYRRFCQDLHDQWDCDTVVLIGDLFDLHAISFHAQHPECPGPKDEYELAKRRAQLWYKAFPKAHVCIGNHDERPLRLAESVSIPARFLRNYSDVWETPHWHWAYSVTIDDVYYYHGVGANGINPAFNAARSRLMSVVVGHTHSVAGVKWSCGPSARIFGMDTGCGIDQTAWQFAYGRHMLKRPILAAGVVIDGIPYHEIMPIGAGERYNRRRA